MGIKYSIIIPIYNEEENIEELVSRLQEVISKLDGESEVIFVNDGSTDRSYDKLLEAYKKYDNIVLVSLARNYGQTYALSAGFEVACGSIIISMDGDLQHDPAEIPLFIDKIKEGYDVVSGWRKKRKDDFLTRKIPSRTANWLISLISGIRIHDFGTTFKAYKRDVIKRINLYGEQHRFIPALASWLGANITEIPISNIVRKKGKSNYGLERTFKVILDLIMLRFLLKYSTKPLYFFGLPGLIFELIGVGIGLVLLWKKIFLGTRVLITHGPLMFFSVLLLIVGMQFISLGILAEMLSRAYFEIQEKKPYIIKNILKKERKSI
jgi:glycosyltransferase involved in cell wall biosynthesis